MTLERCNDPECPKCGCNQSRVVADDSRWGQPRQRRACGACGFEWNSVVKPAETKKHKPSANAKKLHQLRTAMKGLIE